MGLPVFAHMPSGHDLVHFEGKDVFIFHLIDQDLVVVAKGPIRQAFIRFFGFSGGDSPEGVMFPGTAHFPLPRLPLFWQSRKRYRCFPFL
jgi:hypothetical protein